MKQLLDFTHESIIQISSKKYFPQLTGPRFLCEIIEFHLLNSSRGKYFWFA